MIASGLLRQQPLTSSRMQVAKYDFVLDEIREWLAISAMFGNWSPDGLGLEPDAEAAVRALLGSEELRIDFPMRDRLRVALLEMPEPAARRLLDKLLTLSNAPENLTFAFQVMQSGRAPSAAVAWEAVRLCFKLVTPDDPEMTIEELFVTLKEDFGGPHAHPTEWATILGLYAYRLPGASMALHTAIDQRDWLGDMVLVGQIKDRIIGQNALDACAAMFEVLNWAFVTLPFTLPEMQARHLEDITRLMIQHLDKDDGRSDFALWALNWICMGSSGVSPWIDLAIIDADRLANALACRRRSLNSRRFVAAMLSKIVRQQIPDPHEHWLSSVALGRFFGSNPFIYKAPTRNQAHANAVRAALINTNDPFTRGAMALASIELGADDPSLINIAIDFVSGRKEYNLHDRIIAAMGISDKEIVVENLAMFLSSEQERLRIQAVMALLVTADQAIVRRLRESQESKNWKYDVKSLIDSALGM